jgi:hypothetical protein
MLIATPYTYDGSLLIGTVTYVDATRFSCGIKTLDGKTLSDVQWLLPTGGNSNAGVHCSPNVGDGVVISTALGFSLIIGALPKVGVPSNEQGYLVDSTPFKDLGSVSSARAGVTRDPEKPKDFMQGDLAFTTKGGGLFALLASGGIILRSSKLSQIITSKMEGLVRIVSRNYQRYSDSSSSVAGSAKGRLYHWFGADKDILKNKAGTQRYQEVYGDVVAGEAKKGNPFSTGTPGAADDRIVKKTVYDVSSIPVMVETIKEDGTISFVVGTANESKITVSPTQVLIEQGTSKITLTGSTATIDVSGKVTVKGSGVDLDTDGAPKGIVTGDSICAFTGLPHCNFSVTVKASK